ncbi:MAG: HAD family hydrolase [Nitrospinales bacterium]
MGSKDSNSREGLKWSKVLRFIALPFCPSRLRVYIVLKRFEDLPIKKLVVDGIQGVLLDADGTLGTHHTKIFPQTAVDMVQLLVEEGIKVAIYTNSTENRFHQFEDIPIVSDVLAKPDPLGFKLAMTKYLLLDDPDKVCMIGDSFITDGGAVDAGMKFIYVYPLTGKENPFHKFTRYLAYLCARLQNKNEFELG